MASSPTFDLADQSTLLVKRDNSYLGVYAVNVYVRDQDRSLRFYVEQLGFNLAFDVRLQSGQRWVGVAPPDGTAVLTLIAPDPDSDEYKLIGQPTQVLLSPKMSWPRIASGDDAEFAFATFHALGASSINSSRETRLETLRRCCLESRLRFGAECSPASKISTGIPSRWSVSMR